MIYFVKKICLIFLFIVMLMSFFGSIEVDASTILIQQTENTNQPAITNTQWFSQSWTAPSNFISDRVDFYVGNKQGNGFDMTVGFKATDGSGHPTGAYLWSATFTPGDYTAPGWYSKSVSNISFSNGVIYSLVFSSTATGGDYFWINGKETTNPYVGGKAFKSTNQGASWADWAADPNGDMAFKIYEKDKLTLSTDAATEVTESSATLNGQITMIGDANATVRGFEWDTNSGEPYSDSWYENGSFGVAAFTHGLSSLTAGTTYYFRAEGDSITETKTEGNKKYTVRRYPIAHWEPDKAVDCQIVASQGGELCTIFVTPNELYDNTDWDCAKRFETVKSGFSETVKLGMAVVMVIVCVVGIIMLVDMVRNPTNPAASQAFDLLRGLF